MTCWFMIVHVMCFFNDMLVHDCSCHGDFSFHVHVGS